MTRRNIIILLLKKRKKLTKGKEIKTRLTVKVKYNFFLEKNKNLGENKYIAEIFFLLCLKLWFQDEDDSRENLAEEVTRGDSESALPEGNHGDTDIEETGEKQESIVEVDPRNVQVGSN